MATAAAGPDNASADPVPEPRAGFWRAVLTGVCTVLLVAVLALAVALAVVPRVMSGEALTVLTGSMEPTYSPGDMVVSAPQERYDVGDVVTFQPVSGDPTLITHRVVAIRLGGPEGTRYVTRGDANGTDDDPIKPEQIMGEVIYHVPYVGHLGTAAGRHRDALIAVAGAALVGYGLYAVATDAISKRKRRRSASSNTPARGRDVP